LLAARNCNVQESDGICPVIGCYKCAMATPLENLNLLQLPLVNSTVETFGEPVPVNLTANVTEPSEDTQEKGKYESGLITWLLIGVIVVLLILVLILGIPHIKKLAGK